MSKVLKELKEGADGNQRLARAGRGGLGCWTVWTGSCWTQRAIKGPVSWQGGGDMADL